jgi:hypothetical protein
LKINASFLKAANAKGVYGFYVLSDELDKLGIHDRTPGKRIYIYVGTVEPGTRGSVAARFVGHHRGERVSTDAGKTLDTDVVVSCAIVYLCDEGLNVFLHILSHTTGPEEEVRIAWKKEPILQEVKGTKKLQLCVVDRKIPKDKAKNVERDVAFRAAAAAAVGAKVRERLANPLTVTQWQRHEGKPNNRTA